MAHNTRQFCIEHNTTAFAEQDTHAVNHVKQRSQIHLLVFIVGDGGCHGLGVIHVIVLRQPRLPY